MRMRTAVYPGTFDPITHGHGDIIQRSARLVDRLIVGVASNLSKTPLFSDKERVAMVAKECAARAVDIRDVEIRVVQFDSLVVDFATREGATMIIRGLRSGSDFDYEYQMTGMNRQINPNIETVFLMADLSMQATASRLVKEIAIFGGDVSAFLSPAVADRLTSRLVERGLQRRKP